jgi:hypothetical protein
MGGVLCSGIVATFAAEYPSMFSFYFSLSHEDDAQRQAVKKPPFNSIKYTQII